MSFNGLGPNVIASGGQMNPVIEKAGFGHRQALLSKGDCHIQKMTTILFCYIKQFFIDCCDRFHNQARDLHRDLHRHDCVQSNVTAWTEINQPGQHALQDNWKVQIPP